MREFELLDRHEIDNLLDLEEAKEERKASRLSKLPDALQTILLGRMAQADAQGLIDSLTELRKGDPHLYAEAMRALQVPFGNQAVNQLHEQIVSGARSREAEPPNIVSTAAYLKGRAVEVGLPAVEGTAGQPALEDPEFLRTLDADFAALRVELDRIGSLPHVNTQEALEQVLSLRRQWGDRGEQLAAQPEWRQRVDGAYREVVERVILRAMESSDQDGQLKFHMDSQGQSDLVGLLQQIGVDQEFFKRHGLDLEFLREQGPALMSSMFDKLGKAQWQAEIPTGAPEMGARRSRRASPVGAEPGVRININLGKILQNLFQPEIARLASKLGMAGQDVHIHSDETSRQITESRGATGVAMGDVIHLHPERVEPSSDEGRRVLAHEMAHLAQAELPGTEYSSETALDAEIEADEFSRSYVAGEAVSLPEVSRAPMAMAADVDAAQLTEEEKKRRQDRARALPASLKTTMEKAFRTDFSTVKVYEGDQASQMGALAYTQGEEIHFGPGQYEPDSQSGRELLGHELAHVVQQREGRVASQSSRGDYAVNQDSHLEAEADQQGALAAQGVEVAGGPTMAIGPEVESMADAQATPQAMLDSSAPIQMQEGEEAAEVKIKMAGDMYQIRRGGDQARLVKDIRWEPVSGLVLTQADLEFNGDDIVRGNLRGSLVVGEYVSAESITLSVNSNGTVDTSISNARLTVGDLIVGAIDCRISANGISGKATINPDQITVGNNLVVKGGSMELKLDTTGNIQAKGTLTLEVAGIGDLTLKAKLDNTSLSGKMTLKLAEPLELVTGVKLETVSLEGDYNKEAFELRGKVKLDVLQWAKAEITGSFKYPEKTWSATGTLTQSKAYTAGELEISKGELTVNLENGDLKEVKGRADFAYKQWNGDVKGTYDVPSSSFTGDGKVQLTDPLSFSGGGIKLLSAKGEVKVKDNALTEVTGSASAEIPYEGQPRFKVSVERATIDVPASEFSGKGSAELIPTLTISAGNTTVTLKAGKVSAEVEKNRFKRADIQQKIEAEVTTDFAERTITLQGGVEAGSIEGTQISCDASLNLKSPISWEKGDVKATLKTGSIKVKLEQNVLQSTKFDAEANLSVSNIEGASEPLRLKGRLSGEYKPSGIDIDTTVNLEPPFTWEKGDVGVTLTSGSVKLDVKSGVLQSFQFATKAQVEVKNIKGASGPLQLAGQLGGEYKQSGLDLDTTVDLMPPFVFGKDNVTATFNSGSVKLDVKKSKFKSFKADVDANVVIDKIEGAKAGPLNLHSKTTIGYTPEGLDIDADLKLVPPFVFGKNNVTATFNSGKVALKVEKSKFKSFAADVDANVVIDKIEGAKAGPLNLHSKTTIEYTPQGLDIDAELKLVPTFVFGKDNVTATFNSGKVALKVEKSKFKSFAADVDANVDIKGIDGAQGPLKLNSKAIIGYTPDGVDIDTDLKLLPTFNWEKDNTAVTFNSGSVKVKVEKNVFKFFKADVDANVDIKGIDGARGPLKLNSKAIIGYTPDGVDIDTDLKLLPTFIWEKENTTVTFNSGSVKVKVEKNVFKFFKTDVDANVDITGIDNAQGPLKLNSKLVIEYSSNGLNIDTELRLLPRFVYGKDDVTATFKSGMVAVKVEQGVIKSFSAAVNADVEVRDIQDAKGPLKLNGGIKLDWNPEGINVNATLDLVPTFVYEQGDTTVTFKSGSLGIKVEKSVFKSFSAAVNADVEVRGIQNAKGPLKLNGDIKLDWNPEGINVNATLDLVPTFVYEQGDTTVTFKSGSLGIKVEKSVFKSFSAAVNADVEVRGIQGAKGPLKLNGDIKLDWNPKGIDVNTTLALVGKFVYESGKVTATFNSGSIKIKVEKSVFKSFSAQVDVNVEVKDIPGATSTLKLHSNLKIDWSQKGIDIDATLDLLPSFTYERGKVSLVFNSGSIKLKIDKGRFTSFKFDVNATILVKEIPNCASPLVVNGKIDGTYSESKIDINASLTLIPPFVYEQGSFKANFLGGTLSLVITNSDLIEFGVSGLKIQAEMKIAGKTIKATGDVFTGKYIKGNIDLKAKVTLDPPPIEFKSGEKFGFELDPGSFVEISVTKSKLDYIKGKVTGKVNWEGPFLQIDAEFTYSEAGVDVDGSAKLLALKKIFGPVGDNQYAFWLRPTEGYTATISVKKGDLKEVGGSIAFKVTDKGGDLIVGSAEGKWEAKTGKFTGGGGIFLGRDLDFTVGDFTIKFKKDSGGGGKVEDSKLIELSGRLTCEIWDKDGKFVTVEASGKYNAVDNNIEHAEGSLTLNRPWSLLGGKIIVSNVKGSGLIKDNKIRSVSGSAEIDMPDWNIKGGFTKISWSNLTGQDVYEGSGWLHVKLLGGKVEGRVTVRKFKAVGGSTEFDVGGEVKYQLNKYLGGKLTVDIDQNLDPKLGGTLEINNAELYPGRDLINKVVEIVPPVGASVYGITFGAGCDAALKVQLLPVLFSGNIGVSNFYPLRMNVPRFDMTFGVSTGVKLQASLIPYLFLGLGVPSVSAGVKLKGRVSLNVPVVVSAGLHLFADESTFGGDFTVGASIRPSLELGFQPVLYARAGGASTPDYPLMEEKTYTFPDLFVFEWNKKFLFGDAGHDEAAGGGAPAPQPSGGPVTQEQQAATSATAPVEQEPTGPAVDNQQPDIGAAEQTSGQGGQDGQASEMEQKFKRIEEIAGHIANIAALVEFAADVLTYGTLLSFIQPFPLNYLVCALGVVLIKHGGSFQFLADGVKSLVWLIGELADWIWGLMPPWLKNIWARFKALYDMGAAAAAKTVGQDIRAACNNIFGSTWGPVLQPLFDWLADRASNLISALGELTANPITWVKCILMIVADAISGVVDFFRALGRVIRNIKKLLEKLVREGDIAAIDLDTDDWCKDPFGTYINIPSLLEGYRSGPSDDCGPWAVGMAVQWGIDTFLDVPKSHRGSKDGWDYGGKFT